MNKTLTIEDYIKERTLDDGRKFFFNIIKTENTSDKTKEEIYVCFLNKNDLVYDKNKKQLKIHIKKCDNKELNDLLKQLFIPPDEIFFDLIEAIKNENIELVLINNDASQNDEFFEIVYNFFDNIDFIPTYQGIWKDRM